MLKEAHVFRWQSFAILSVALAAAGCFLAFRFRDAHIFARFGALIASVGAVLVILQIRFDMSVERSYQDFLQAMEDDGEPSAPAISEAAERIKRTSELRAHTEVRGARTSAAFIVAVITGIGECLHGWGDVMLSPWLH